VTSSETALAPTENRALAPESGVSLMKDEKVLLAGEPQRDRLLRYFGVSWLMVGLLTIFMLPFVPLAWLIARAYVRKHGYWLTDSRVIVTNGIIGFRTRSIPLERVSDVAISSNWLEKWMGLQSVVVRDMTGEAMSGATMLASADASKLQHEILDRVHSVNRRLPAKQLTAMPQVYRGSDGQSSEMLELLRRIESNTRDRGS